MKGCRKCSDGSASDLLQQYDDSVRHMAAVSKGARKIMTEIPDQLTSVFTWTVFAGACTFVLLTATCMVLVYESCDTDDVAVESPRSEAQQYAAAGPAIRQSCSSSKDVQRLRRHASKLMTLDIGAGDVHLVFTPRDALVPWSYACSLESALKAAGNNSRVNVFIVHGVGAGRELDQSNGPRPVLLSSSLADLKEAYGTTDEGGRLNVVHVDLDDCLEYTPFRGMGPSEISPAQAVQLAVLWQFGGTALDAGVVAIRGEVYRASGTTVVYSDRTVSSPVACHAFVYDMMSHAKDLAHASRSRRLPYQPITGGTLADSTAAWTGRVPGNDTRRLTDGLECGGHGGVTDCYYEWCSADRAMLDSADNVLSSCPVVRDTVTIAAATNRDHQPQRADDRISDNKLISKILSSG